jgi:putative ABC transport system permease protein
MRFMGWLWKDVRFGLRGLRKERGFAVLAMLALALGIGATTAIFSVIENVLLDPFPYTDANRLVTVMIHDSKGSGPGGRPVFLVPEYLDYRDQNHVFDRVIGVNRTDVLYKNGQGTEQFDGAEVTTDTFQFLGMGPLLGRGIQPDDEKPGAPPVFVMSYKMWRKTFGFDRNVVGRSFVLNGETRACIGVMPERFTWWGADLWLPTALSRSDPDVKTRRFFLLGHMKPGVTERAVISDFDVLARREARLYPKEYPQQFTVETRTLLDGVVGRFRSTLLILMGAVTLLLLIACGNVANLLLARATAREKEMAIRASLGASRGRLLGQLLIESLLLALGGAVLGCVFAYGGLKALVALIPEQTIPDEAVIRLNLPVLLFALATAVLTALLCGIAPALHASRRDLQGPLRDTGKGVGGGSRHGGLRNALVVAEVALSIVLLAGAGLLMRSLFALQHVELGLNPDKILVARLPLPRDRYKTVEQKTAFFRQLLPRLHALPGVAAATETSTLPPYGGIGSDIEIPGKTHSEKWNAIFQLCSDRYFDTLGIRLLRGRLLTEAEVDGARKVAVVNETLVKKFFGAEGPLGRRIKLAQLSEIPDPVKDPTFEIVGVVADVKNHGIQDPPEPELFIPYTVTGAFERGILVRTAREPLPMLNAVRKEIWSVDSNVALTLTGTLDGYLKKFSYAQPQFGLVLISVFAGIGLLLVSIGVYGVMAYTVSRQTYDIGIRMALGAPQSSVLGLVIKMGVKLIALGGLLGLAASLGLTRLIASQLWGVSPSDPLTFVSVIALLAIVGLAACYFPARRASLVDPLIALRHE